MSSTYSNLKLQLMATGENLATWGNVTNVNLGTALEEAVVGSANVTFASANVTLTLSDTNTTQTARNLRLNLIGTTGGSTRNLVVPSIEKVYIVNNTCADSVLVKTAAGSGITVPTGKTMWVYNNGTDVVDATTHLSSLTLASALPVASGGTGGNTAATARSALSAAKSGTNTDITSLQPLAYMIEGATISATASTGTINFDAVTQSVLYYTTNASGNWTVNIRGNSGTTLASLLSTGQSITVAFLSTNGGTGYYNISVQVDGTTSGVTTRWQNGVAPSSGNTSSIDVYTYTVIKTGSATYTVLASQTKFA
jgi:hypothetical protein